MKKKKQPRYGKIPHNTQKALRQMATTRKRKQVLAEANKRLSAALEGLKGYGQVSGKEIDKAFLRAKRNEGKDAENVKIFEGRLKSENKLLRTLVKESERVKRQEMKLHGMKGVINAQHAIKAAAHARNTLKINQALLKKLQQAKKRKEKKLNKPKRQLKGLSQL